MQDTTAPVPSIDEVPDRYRWDLTQIFETTADWQAALDRLQNAAASLEDATARVGGDPTAHVADVDAALRTAFEHYESVVTARSELDLYSLLRTAEDTTDAERQDRRDRFQAVAADAKTAEAEFRRALGRIDVAAVPDGYEAFVENLRAGPPEPRSPEAESVLAAVEDSLDGYDRVLRTVTGADFDPITVETADGDGETLTPNTFRSLLERPDRDFRRRVYERYYDALAETAETHATAVAEKVRATRTVASLRGFDATREMALNRPSYPETGIRDRLPDAVHDALVDALAAHRGPLERTREVRRERLGVDALRPWDLHVPLADAPAPDVSYEEARAHVVAAMAPLGESYQSRVAAFLDDARVDAMEATEKRNLPAFCPSAPTAGAYVMMNYQSNVRTMFYLCHELGHAMQVTHLRDVRDPLYVTTPQPICEVPSVLHELLLIDHLVDEGDDAMREHALARGATMLRGNLYLAARGATFERRIYDDADGALTRERIESHWTDLYETWGVGVDWDDRARHRWMNLALDRVPYSSYQYVLGAAGAVHVHDRVREGSLTTDEYVEFLRVGGTDDSLAALERIGLDPERPATYENAGDRLRAYVER